ncbi:MAG: thioredoxin family protein [Polyangiaceae bacterium]|nr:thioredoxin family protein [Myxococcales bacterium]MCB9587454.1 thioredoxin family protein [Polyangiaceae bacterium]MCB9605749.1 thioredoxin family protein [Polyangiaceae bacterium]
MRRAWLLTLPCLVLFGCDSTEHQAKPEPASASATAKVEVGAPPRFLRGPTGGADISSFVREKLTEANAAQKAGKGGYTRVLVYVGATWCEPCQYFHQAVTEGKLDRELQGVTFVEFDLDQDRDALASAGYASRMIPLFALPDAAGRGTEQRISGSIKGPGATANILPRLDKLLAGEPVN